MGMTDDLAVLAQLHRQGALNDDEFARAKARVLRTADPLNPSPLRRSRSDRWLGGVCGGLERISGVASWAWRVIFTALVLCGGSGVLIYLLLWCFVPWEPLQDVCNRLQPG